MSEGPDTLELLRRAAAGDLDARDRAWSHLHAEVLVVARSQRRRWSGDWTLDTRVLAHEVFLKLFGDRPPEVRDRGHLFALLAKAIRQILVNYSEARRAAKRGGGAAHVPIEEAVLVLTPEVSEQLLDLDEALRRFHDLDERAAQVVELRFFAGLTYDEIADTLGIARATAVRDWEAARAWLQRELGSDTMPDA